MLLLCMNYWRPKVVGRDNYKKGQEMGAVGALQVFLATGRHVWKLH